MRPQDGGFAVGAERELSHLHLEPLGTRLSLRETHASDTRLGVCAAWNAVAIDGRCGLPRHVRYRHHAFHGRYMRELRRSSHHVADGVDARFTHALVLIGLDESAVEF